MTGGFANYVKVLFHDFFGFEVPPAVLIVIAVGLSWLLAYKDIQLSMRTTLAIEFASVGLILLILIATLFTEPSIVDRAQIDLKV